MTREKLVADTFVQLADTLVAEFDAVDLMHTLAERSVELLDADAAGLVLADPRGRLEVVASTTHAAELVELFALQNHEGPCLDCLNSGAKVVNVDLLEAYRRWPRFTPAMVDAGYESTHALPLRLRDHVIGAINLFCVEQKQLGEADLMLGQALADVATISLLQERVAGQKELLAEQLQTALNTRIVIEQAKGSMAERAGVDVDEAFALMRAHGRRTQQSISAVAAAVIDGSLQAETLTKS